MEKEQILMKMMETVGRARRGQDEKKRKQSKEKEHDSAEKTRKHHHKMSPVAENTLILLYREGKMNQRTLAHRLNVTGQAVSELMKKFEEKELIQREAGDLNNENIVSLTEKGEEKGKQYQDKITKIADKMFSDFSEDDLITLSLLLDKMKIEEDLP